MSKKSSSVFLLVAAVSAAGILSSAGRKRSAAESAITQSPLSAQAAEPGLVPTPATPDRVSKSDRFLRNAMIFVALGSIIAGIIAVAATPLIAGAVPASNENIRSTYGINVIDNPNFQGNRFLKGGDDGLAYVCERPNYHALNNSKELQCWLP